MIILLIKIINKSLFLLKVFFLRNLFGLLIKITRKLREIKKEIEEKNKKTRKKINKVFEIIIKINNLIKKKGKGGKANRLNIKKIFVLFQTIVVAGVKVKIVINK